MCSMSPCGENFEIGEERIGLSDQYQRPSAPSDAMVAKEDLFSLRRGWIAVTKMATNLMKEDLCGQGPTMRDCGFQ